MLNWTCRQSVCDHVTAVTNCPSGPSSKIGSDWKGTQIVALLVGSVEQRTCHNGRAERTLCTASVRLYVIIFCLLWQMHEMASCVNLCKNRQPTGAAEYKRAVTDDKQTPCISIPLELLVQLTCKHSTGAVCVLEIHFVWCKLDFGRSPVCRSSAVLTPVYMD